uniref:Aminotransferase-like plant mobile domain-containing protein n=1 Tax=Fagus sylvatica TaxID=28930 RepID=A0A2N9GKF6_FAGSY
MASSSSHPPPDTAMASGGDSEIPTADAGTMDTGSVGDESVDGSRFSPVPEDDREDFAFPLPGPLWMLRGQEATADQVWVPPLSSISDLRIQRGDMQPVPIDFEFPCSAAADWFHWVADEFLDVKFCALLERAGVAEAILPFAELQHTWRITGLLPVLGDMDPFAVEMSEEETLVEQALMARASTRINAWSVYFAKGTEPAIRRAAFVAYWLCKCLFGDAPYYSMKPLYFRLAILSVLTRSAVALVTLLLPASIPSALQTFLWERSLNYQEIGNDNSQNKGEIQKYVPPHFEQIPGFKDQSAAGLSLDFSCHSVLYWFSDIASQSFELSPDDTRSLTYLSAVNPGWLPVWSDKGVEYTHYCPNRVRRQFGLDQSVPGSPSETLPRTPSIAPFLNDHAFDYWSQSVSRMVIPCGGRLGICTVAMQEYWLRVAAAMADYVKQGRGTRVPLPNHHAHPMETTTLSPPTQTAISYAERQGLGFAEWDGSRDGWILYSTAFPSGWKESVKVVEERLRLDSKRGKGGKKIDSGKGASSPAASKQKPKSAAKTSSKRPKVAMDMSMIPPSELGGRALMAPGTSKKKSAAGTSKSQKKSAVDPPVDPTEDTSPPSKETESSAIQEKSAPPSTKAKSQPRSKSVAVKKAKSKPTQKSAVAPPSSSEEPAAESATPIEKESAVPTPPSTMYGRTRSKRKAAEEQVRSQAKRKVGDEGEGSDQAPIVIEEVSGGDDVVDAGVGTTEVNESIVERQEVELKSTDDVAAKDSPIDWTDSDDAMADEALGVTVSDEAVLVMADEAAHEVTPVMADETLVGMADETLAGSAAEEDQDIDSVDSEETIADEPQPLQIVPFADQRDEPRTIDPIEFHSNPPFARMTSVMEGISLFGVAPHFERILREESSPMVVNADGGGMADTEVRGVDVVPEDVEAPVLVEKESVAHVVSAAPSSSQTQSAAEVIIPGRVAAFFARFEERAPNPYPDWHFWKFEGPLVAYGNFWVHQDAVPLFAGVVCEVWGLHYPFQVCFKTLSEPKILSWRSVVQDLIAVGFDLDFMLEHLRKVARKFFGEAIASEMKIVQEQISSLQSTLAVLLSYQGELMSAACSIPRSC